VKYDWPGNVRELENAIERALVLSPSEVVQPEICRNRFWKKASHRAMKQRTITTQVKELKKQLILNALEQTNRNYTEAAELLACT